MIKLYGVRQWGAGAAEALLAFAGRDYQFIDVEASTSPARRATP